MNVNDSVSVKKVHDFCVEEQITLFLILREQQHTNVLQLVGKNGFEGNAVPCRVKWIWRQSILNVFVQELSRLSVKKPFASLAAICIQCCEEVQFEGLFIK